MLKDLITKYLNQNLYNVSSIFEVNSTMFDDLQLQNSLKHAFTMTEDMFAQCLRIIFGMFVCL